MSVLYQGVIFSDSGRTSGGRGKLLWVPALQRVIATFLDNFAPYPAQNI